MQLIMQLVQVLVHLKQFYAKVSVMQDLIYYDAIFVVATIKRTFTIL